MTRPITRSHQCLGFCVTGAVLSQWPTLSTPDQFIDETLMNLPSARHWHLCLCLRLPSFWKAVCDVTCLPPGNPVNLDRAVSHNTLYPLLLQRMSGPKILSPCENGVMMLGLFLGQYGHNNGHNCFSWNTAHCIEHSHPSAISCFRQVFLDTWMLCLNTVPACLFQY